MNTMLCRAGETLAFETAARVRVAGHDAGSALAIRVLRADGETELQPGGRIEAGSRVYLPDGPFALRAAGRVELQVERVPAWPLRRPLTVTPRAVVGRAAALDPRRAIRRAVHDVTGYLQAVHLWPRVEAFAHLGLLGDARLVHAGGRDAPVVAEVRLSVAALRRAGAGVLPAPG